MMRSCEPGPAPTSLTSQEPETDNELDRFLKTIPEKDCCPTRRTYNRTERRFGSARARIIDYLVVRGGNFDPVIVGSGDTLDIFVKACYDKEVTGSWALGSEIEPPARRRCWMDDTI